MRIVLTVLLALSTAAWGGTEGGPLTVISCRVSFSSEGHSILHITARNASGDALRTNRAYLPWGITLNTSVVVVPVSGGRTPLVEPPVVDDPGQEPIVVPGGETVEGTIDLTSRFPEMAHYQQEGVEFFVGWKALRHSELFGGKAPAGAAIVSKTTGRCVVF